MVKTFIHEPMVRMSETIDENNVSSKFSYDSFNRLDIIREADGNIVTKNEY